MAARCGPSSAALRFALLLVCHLGAGFSARRAGHALATAGNTRWSGDRAAVGSTRVTADSAGTGGHRNTDRSNTAGVDDGGDTRQRLAARARCALNGDPVLPGGACRCDAGWTGERCAQLALLPASPVAHGLDDTQTPTWGGVAVWHATTRRWHLIVGSRAVPFADDAKDDYPCDSRILRAVSRGADPAGPYDIAEVLVPRSTWEPGLATSPRTGELVVMFFGNMSPPAAGSQACNMSAPLPRPYNLTETNTFVMASPSGSPLGPWTKPRLADGMRNSAAPSSTNSNAAATTTTTTTTSSPYRWSCASGNPSPAFHPNGTLFAAVRQNPCWRGFSTREHIGLWRADQGWEGRWVLVNADAPIYGWGNGSESNCTDANGCPSHEDPHLWIDELGGFHLLTHDQNNARVHSTRGAYGWSVDGVRWTLETAPASSAASAWEMSLRWANGTTSPLARRQRASLVRDPVTGAATHLLNGADLHSHLPPGSGACEGCHWGQGFTLVQPLAASTTVEGRSATAPSTLPKGSAAQPALLG